MPATFPNYFLIHYFIYIEKYAYTPLKMMLLARDTWALHGANNIHLIIIYANIQQKFGKSEAVFLE